MKAIQQISSQYHVGLSLQGHKKHPLISSSRTDLKLSKYHSIHLCTFVNYSIQYTCRFIQQHANSLAKKGLRQKNILKAIQIIPLDDSVCEKYCSWEAGLVSVQKLLLIWHKPKEPANCKEKVARWKKNPKKTHNTQSRRFMLNISCISFALQKQLFYF